MWDIVKMQGRIETEINLLDQFINLILNVLANGFKYHPLFLNLPI